MGGSTKNTRHGLASFRYLLGIFAIVLLTGGCYAIEEYIYSHPQLASEGRTISQAGKIKVGGTVMFIRPANLIPTASGQRNILASVDKFDPQRYGYRPHYYGLNLVTNPPDFFIVEILFSLKNEVVNFNPSHVTLRLNDSGIHPVGYFLLERRYKSNYSGSPIYDVCKRPGAPAYNIDNPLQFEKEQPANTNLTLEANHDYCFALKFNHSPPDPRIDFDIKIDDLKVDNRDIPMLIHYGPRTYSETHQ